jgi:hypothetical protein
MRSALLLCTFLAFVGCDSSHKAAIRPEEFRGEMRALVSLAAEGHFVVDFVQKSHATEIYAKQQPLYLAKETTEIEKKLDQAIAPPNLQTELIEAQQAAARLHKLFEKLADNPSDYPSLNHELQSIEDEAERLRHTQ